MKHLHAKLIALALPLTIGCNKPVSPSSAAPKPPTELEKRAEVGAAWVREADLVVETIRVPRGSVRIVRSSHSDGTNRVYRLPELEAAFGSNKGSAAVVIIPKMLDLDNATNVVSELRRVGFRSVRVVVEGWGMRFPGPEI